MWWALEEADRHGNCRSTQSLLQPWRGAPPNSGSQTTPRRRATLERPPLNNSPLPVPESPACGQAAGRSNKGSVVATGGWLPAQGYRRRWSSASEDRTSPPVRGQARDLRRRRSSPVQSIASAERRSFVQKARAAIGQLDTPWPWTWGAWCVNQRGKKKDRRGPFPLLSVTAPYLQKTTPRQVLS